MITLDYKEGTRNRAFEEDPDQEKRPPVGEYNSTKTTINHSQDFNGGIPSPAVYEEDNTSVIDRCNPVKGDIEENIDQILEDMRGGQRYWRVIGKLQGRILLPGFILSNTVCSLQKITVCLWLELYIKRYLFFLFSWPSNRTTTITSNISQVSYI